MFLMTSHLAVGVIYQLFHLCFFCFFLHSFVFFFLPILFGVSFKILGLFVHMYLFVCFFFVKILVRFSLFFLEGI